MFLQVVPDSPDEVFHVTMNMPIGWNQHLTPATIKDTTTLQLRSRELQDTLINAAVSTAANLVTTDNLLSVLQKAGFLRGSAGSSYSKGGNPSSASYRRYTPRTPAATVQAVETEEVEENTEEVLPNDPAITHQAFAVMKRGDPPPSRRGPFPFEKQDQVHTSIGRLPAWPCRACGSSNHWDRECPMWDRFQNKIKSAKWAEKEDSEEDGHLYTQVYQSYLAQIDESMYVSSDEQINVSARLAEKMSSISSTPPNTLPDETPSNIRKSSVEEVEDEDTLLQRTKPKATGTSALEDADDGSAVFETLNSGKEEDCYYGLNAETDPADADFWPPPTEALTIKVPKRKKAAPGRAAVGTSVLSIRGRVNRVQEREIDLRLDSGADVSLVSLEFLSSLKVKPSVKQGLKMKLWQLTSKNETLAGYVTLPLFVEAEDGTLLESEVEAYIVPGMSVDILLGEDYQLGHEIAVKRSVESGTRIEFEGLQHSVRAVPVARTKDFERMSSTHYGTASYVRAKAHRRAQAKRHRKRVKFGAERNTIRAAVDLKITPNSVASLKVDGYFEETDGKDWLVEKSLLANDDDSFFAVPNILFSSSCPIVPIMNPTERPRYIGKGEVVGTITDPSEFQDKPTSEEHWEGMNKSALSIVSLISCLSEDDADVQAFYTAQSSTKAPEGTFRPAKADQSADEEAEAEPLPDDDQWGPKTAEMPDPQFYASKDMEELLNIGSLPEHLKEKAWAMLKKRVNVFAFDGRLGHHPTKVHIHTVDGQVLISIPMYGSSPAKKLVIEEQLKKWFELGVIEPSKSPWSAPVVIAYRNGKPRFCVDYRKLNAVTIPDEFPIPRQSENLSALSGAQVLSSLDALAGFTHSGLFSIIRRSHRPSRSH